MEELVGTNLELFGSELEHKIKEASAKGEEEWTKINMNDTGLYVWKVEKFKLKPVKQELFGIFYEGDSYVVFNISKNNNNSFNYNIHFWLGNTTTQDESGTAAYKTVELDTYLSGKAVQNREVQANESDLFRSYFLQGITYKIGGVETGFHKVEPYDYSNYKPLLYRVHDSSVTQVPLSLNSLTEDDVYVLDCGLSVYVYIGKSSTHKERLFGEYTSLNIKGLRKNCIVYDVDKDNYNVFVSCVSKHCEDYTVNSLYRVNEENGVTLVEGPISRESFDSNDAFIFNVGHTTFVWIGKGSSYNESLNAWRVAVRVAEKTSSITLVKEGFEPELFKLCF